MFLPAHFPLDESATAGIDRMMTQVELAERSGFDSLLLGHHYLANTQFLQPLSLAGFLAANTTRIRLGFGVYLLPLVNPVQLAEELATLDILSSGRIIAGFGAGYRQVEFDAAGVPFDERFARIDEYVPLLRSLWSGEAVTASGSFGSLTNAQIHLRPVQPGGPPIWLGAFGDIGIRRCARLDTPWLAAPEGTVTDLQDRLASYDRHLGDAGRTRPTTVPLLRELFVADTRAEAIEVARPHLEAQYRDYRTWKHGLGPDELIADNAIVGDPEDVVQRLREYAALGFTDIIVRVQWAGLPFERVMRGVELLGTEVLPALADTTIGVAEPTIEMAEGRS